MSNTRKLREMNGGRLTRPRDQWRGKPRNRLGRSADAASMLSVFSGLLGRLSTVRVHQRSGDR